LASVIVTLKDEHTAKVVFVRDRRKKDWLALLSTDIHFHDEDIVRIYSKRWDIEVFFKKPQKACKLNLCNQSDHLSPVGKKIWFLLSFPQSLIYAIP